ncbi:MAG TPA: GFA family protein [Gammaproteobacteria bacterium]|nr:GFA family protein [Gammaproteobacteria bacterium]
MLTDITVKGGCLCGAVRYEVTGEPARFYHCHCQRCRKATGTGHASNVMLKADSIRWLGDESLLRSYKLPEVERFGTHFCSNCGSLMPREVPALGMVLIPAGSLDSEPGIEPMSHIFYDSRAPWSCADGGLPTFAEYPPAKQSSEDAEKGVGDK